MSSVVKTIVAMFAHRERRVARTGALMAREMMKPRDEQRGGLVRLLAQGPRRHGFLTELWTLERVAAVVRREFGVRHHPSAVWHVLRALGWSCQKPQRPARERDEEAIRRWRRRRKRPGDRILADGDLADAAPRSEM